MPADTRGVASRWFIDPAALMQIKNLTLRAKTIAEGFATGLHRSPLHGFSVEFAEYRPYVLGDDPRNLDWKLLARTDRYYIKQYEDETNRRCYVAIDQSKSMAYGSTDYSKAEYAKTLAATLAYYLTLQRDAVGVMTCGVAKSDFLPPRHRKGHLQQIMRLLDQSSVGAQSNLEQSLTELATLSRRRGLVVLISDLLVDPETIFQPLGYLRGRGHEILLIRVLDTTEVDLSLDKSSMIQDMETGREIYVDPEAARADYRRRFEAHESQLIDICHRRGARMVTVTTDQPLDAALLELISNSGSLSAAAGLQQAARSAQDKRNRRERQAREQKVSG
ncbi:MAG: DUF58 domain-containing protein [Pirellulaceae bacterium]